MSRTRFRVNSHSLVRWMSRNSLLEAGTKPEVQETATGLESAVWVFVYELSGSGFEFSCNPFNFFLADTLSFMKEKHIIELFFRSQTLMEWDLDSTGFLSSKFLSPYLQLCAFSFMMSSFNFFSLKIRFYYRRLSHS